MHELNENFENYVSRFNHDVPMIKLKHRHSYRVADYSKKIAESLNLSKEDVQLAYIIGLLHDFGRFEQVKRHDSTNDTLMDHGDYGAHLLFEKGMIENYYSDISKYHIIEQAIVNHNKKEIGDVTADSLIFCKIIRDADKLDIFYLLSIGDIKLMEKEGEVSDDIKIKFQNKESINYEDIKNIQDHIFLYLAFIHDLNFDFSLNELKKLGYVKTFIKKYSSKLNLSDLNIIDVFFNKYI